MNLDQPLFRTIAIPLDAFPGATAAWSVWRYVDRTYTRQGELARLSPSSWVARRNGGTSAFCARGRAAAIAIAFDP